MMRHVVLFGDSIFDNASYVPGGLSVIDLLKNHLAQPWQATLLAIDGSVAADVLDQLPQLPGDASHIVISCGGNDGLMASGIVNETVATVDEALLLLAEMRDEFGANYRRVINAAKERCDRVAVCTVYDAVPDLPRSLRTALALFNEVILREAVLAHIPVIDLRVICDAPEDYSTVSSIEPSAQGGRKIAAAISRLLNHAGGWPGQTILVT
jgi:lysophospholipase L1-like esterase